MPAPLRTVVDDDKLDAEQAIRDLLLVAAAGGQIQHRPAVCHMGVLYGQQRQLGQPHETARAEIERIARAWQLGHWDARVPGIRHIGDDEILALVAEVGRVPVTDWGGLFDLGCQFGQRAEAGMAFDRIYHECGAWLVQWYGGDNPWPPPQLRHPWPLTGQLGVLQRAFVDGLAQPIIPVGVQSLDLIGHGLTHGLASILPVLDRHAEVGYHYVRSGFQLHLTTGSWIPGPTERGWNPLDARDTFRDILAAGAERQLRWHVAALGLKGLRQSMQEELFDLLAWVIDQIGPEYVVLVEGCNEARDTYDGGPADLERLVNRHRTRHPQILHALTAYTGHEKREAVPGEDPLESHRRWTPTWQPFVLQHDFRGGRVHDKIRHMFSNANPNEGPPLVRDMFWRGEPGGPQGPRKLISAQANSHELNEGAMLLMATMAALTRSAWTYTCDPGIIMGGHASFDDMPGYASTPAFLQHLPQDLARFGILSHSDHSKGDRLHNLRDDSPHLREDYAIDMTSGRYVAVRYGEDDTLHKPLARRRGTARWVRTMPPWGQVEVGTI